MDDATNTRIIISGSARSGNAGVIQYVSMGSGSTHDFYGNGTTIATGSIRTGFTTLSGTGTALSVTNNATIGGTLGVTGGVTNGGFDFVLGNADQSTRGNSGSSRALVKSSGNILTVNFANDFTGGVLVDSILTVGGFECRVGTNDQSSRGNTGDSRALFKDLFGALAINKGGDFYGGVRIDSTLSVYTVEKSGSITVANSPGGSNFMSFRGSGGGEIGAIFQNGFGGTTYGTTSDYRLKENILPFTGGLVMVNSVQPKRYKYKVGGTGSTMGFIAHELQTVCPFAVKGVKDGVDAAGKPIYQFLDMPQLVPVLWNAVSELSAQVTALQTLVNNIANIPSIKNQL